MSSSVPVASPDTRAPSFLSTLGNLLIAPRDAFAGVLRRPSPWLPFLLFLVIHVVFAAVWTSKMDVMQFIRNQQEAAGKDVQLPPASAAPIAKAFTAAVVVLAPPVVLILTVLVLWLIYRFFYGSDVTFKQSFTVVTWSFLIIALVSVPLLLGAMALKNEWNEDPSMILTANATLFLDQASTAKPLYALAKALDLFSFWTLWLLASGFGVAMRKPTGSALWGVVVPWAILVAIGVAMAAIF